MDELDPPRSSDFLPSPECNSVLYEDFSKVDALSLTNNEYKVFNPGILVHVNLFEVTIQVTSDKNVKKISISNASLILKDFNPLLYKLPYHKEVLGAIFDIKRICDFSHIIYDDPFDSKEDKIKESKLFMDELDPPRSSDFLPSPECNSVLYEDFSKVDTLSLTNNEYKVFNPGILVYVNLFEVTIRVTSDKNVKKISISNASLILKDFNPLLYKLPYHKEVLGSETLLSFSFKNKEKVFNTGILTFKGVHTSLLSELSHRGLKAFKVIKNFESPMEIFPCSYGEDIRILDVP
nr:hypothetical protein [Tanacetum cinerariifolium]